MRIANDVNALYSLDSDGDVMMEWDGDDEEEEDEEEEDEEEEGEEKEEEVEDEEDDEDEDDGKEPRTIGQGEIINTSDDNLDSIVDVQSIIIPKQHEEMCEHTLWPQPLPPAPGL